MYKIMAIIIIAVWYERCQLRPAIIIYLFIYSVELWSIVLFFILI